MKAIDKAIAWLGAIAIGAFTICATSSVCLAGDIQYNVRLLSPPAGAPPSYSAQPRAISNSGVIVGGSPEYDLDSPALRWDAGAGVATRLTGLGGVNSLGNTQDAAWSINDNGAIVGWGLTADGQSTHALRWDPGSTVPTDIGGGGTTSQAFRINNSGAVIGEGDLNISGQNTRPVYWAPGATTFTVLPSTVVINGVDFTANGRVAGINNAGTLVGQVSGYAGPVGVTWSPPYSSFTYLPSLSGQPVTETDDINNAGTVVGYVERDSGETLHGYRYNAAAGTVSELMGRPGIDPTSGSPATHPLYIQAFAVNDNDVAVGRSGYENQEHAVLWLPGSTDAVDLNSLIDPALGWTLTDAWGINDAGQIIGNFSSPSGGGYYVLTAVPEPAVLVPSLLALAAVRFRPGVRTRENIKSARATSGRR